MSEIVFRLPSMQITYGYVEVTGTPEEFGVADISDPYALGIAYTAYVARFFEGEIEGAKIVAANMEAAPKAAPGKPVKGVSGVRQVEAEPGDPGAAKARLEAGKKPRTPLEETEMAKQVIEKALGATVVEETEVPWEQPAKAATPKPWEKKGAAPRVADIDW